MTTRRYLGLDLGQAQDFTALAVLARLRQTAFRPTAEYTKPPYDVPYLHRFPLGTPYPQIVTSVVALLQTPELHGATLVIDRTGVGRAVGDLFAEALRSAAYHHYVPITITAGHSVSRDDDGGYHVPKKELISATQVLLQTRRLRIAPTLPEATVLVEEFQNFQVKITEAANESFGAWRHGQHDDLVLAVALAAWLGEQQRPYEVPIGQPRVLGGPDQLRGY